jgi:hypothetical protein
MRTLAALPGSRADWLAYAPLAGANVRAGDLAGAERVAALHPGDADATTFYIAQALLEAGDPGERLAGRPEGRESGGGGSP